MLYSIGNAGNTAVPNKTSVFVIILNNDIFFMAWNMMYKESKHDNNKIERIDV